MLKIKDNVDLKQLEKYDFRLNGALNYEIRKGTVTYVCRNNIYKNNCEELYLFKEVNLEDETPFIRNEDLDLLYDLIKAGLVEKVEGDSD